MRGLRNAAHRAADLGPTVEWLADGRIVAWTAGMAGSVDLVVRPPVAEWLSFRLDVDTWAQTYDFWWAAPGQPLQRVAEDLPFVSGQLLFDRIVVGHQANLAALVRFDDLTWSTDHCRTSVLAYGQGVAGTLGVPALSADTSGDVVLTLGNAAGLAAPAALLVGLQQATTPFLGGQLLVAPIANLPLLLPAAGLSTPPLADTKVQACGSPTLFLQLLHLDPAAARGVAMSPGLAVRAAQ